MTVKRSGKRGMEKVRSSEGTNTTHIVLQCIFCKFYLSCEKVPTFGTVNLSYVLTCTYLFTLTCTSLASPMYVHSPHSQCFNSTTGEDIGESDDEDDGEGNELEYDDFLRQDNDFGSDADSDGKPLMIL